jgi:drug/metabolite transporter (DMT)-like permease
MKRTAGIILIALGLIVIVWGAFGFKTREKVLDVGPIHATKETTHSVPYAPIAGAVVVIGGVILLASSTRP